MPETWFGLSKASWTKGSGAIPKASPPNDPPGILSSPTTLASLGPAGVPSVTLSPISSPAPSAAAPSMVSSRRSSGNLPSVSSKPVASSADSRLDAEEAHALDLGQAVPRSSGRGSGTTRRSTGARRTRRPPCP